MLPPTVLGCLLLCPLASAAASGVGSRSDFEHGVLFKQQDGGEAGSPVDNRIDADAANGVEADERGERVEMYLWMSHHPDLCGDDDATAEGECELVCKSYRLPVHEQWPEGAYIAVSESEFSSLVDMCARRERHRAGGTGRKSLSSKLDHWAKKFLIYPGTQWCGKGDRAREFDDLGKHHQEDACCRTHDQCPLVIQPNGCLHDKMAAVKNPYLCNKTPITMSHCNCDLEFHRCLQSANTSTAYTIGNLYFNVVAVRCFANGWPTASRDAGLQAFRINFPKLAWSKQLYNVAASFFSG